MPNVMAARWSRLYPGTPAELALEDAVAALGVPYRTQFPGFLYGFRFYPDFVLPTVGVVLEVDDPGHFKGDQPEKDAERSKYLLRQLDWVVVRCTNEEAIADPRGAVARMLRESGRWPPTTRRTVAQSLPATGRCPPSGRRPRRPARRIARGPRSGTP